MFYTQLRKDSDLSEGVERKATKMTADIKHLSDAESMYEELVPRVLREKLPK